MQNILIIFLLVEFMGIKLAYKPTQAQLIHGLHMDVSKTVDNINISIKYYNGSVIHVREICAIA